MPPRKKILGLPKAVKEWLDAALVEGNFKDYELLAAELKAQGFDISRASVQRYGQAFEARLSALKVASEQAKAICVAAPDDEGAVSEALMRLVQENIFKMLVDFQPEPGQPVNIARIGKVVAELTRATVKQKEWQAAVRAKAMTAADAVAQVAKKGGLTPEAVDTIRREILGIAG